MEEGWPGGKGPCEDIIRHILRQGSWDRLDWGNLTVVNKAWARVCKDEVRRDHARPQEQKLYGGKETPIYDSYDSITVKTCSYLGARPERLQIVLQKSRDNEALDMCEYPHQDIPIPNLPDRLKLNPPLTGRKFCGYRGRLRSPHHPYHPTSTQLRGYRTQLIKTGAGSGNVGVIVRKVSDASLLSLEYLENQDLRRTHQLCPVQVVDHSALYKMGWRTEGVVLTLDKLGGHLLRAVLQDLGVCMRGTKILRLQECDFSTCSIQDLTLFFRARNPTLSEVEINHCSSWPSGFSPLHFWALMREVLEDKNFTALRLSGRDVDPWLEQVGRLTLLWSELPRPLAPVEWLPSVVTLSMVPADVEVLKHLILRWYLQWPVTRGFVGNWFIKKGFQVPPVLPRTHFVVKLVCQLELGAKHFWDLRILDWIWNEVRIPWRVYSILQSPTYPPTTSFDGKRRREMAMFHAQLTEPWLCPLCPPLPFHASPHHHLHLHQLNPFRVERMSSVGRFQVFFSNDAFEDDRTNEHIHVSDACN